MALTCAFILYTGLMPLLPAPATVPGAVDATAYAPGLAIATVQLVQLKSRTSEKRSMAAPDILDMDVKSDGDRWRIDLAWTESAGQQDSSYTVELVTIPDVSTGETEVVGFVETKELGASFYVDRVPVGLITRISRVAVDGSEYAAGVWTELFPGRELSAALPLAPLGRVTIRVGATDIAARQFAIELASGLVAQGVWTHLQEVDLIQEQTTVAYRFAADVDLASRVAAYLPVIGPQDTIRLSELPAAPGEVFVSLVGGPQVLAAPD